MKKGRIYNKLHVDFQQSNGSDVNVFYSTPSCYLYALNQINRTWTVKTDDFFPYAMIPHRYETGYFTSRPALKRYERYSNNVLQMIRQLNAFANTNMRSSIFPLSKILLMFLCLLTLVIGEAMGLMQHHDAITGTERQHVADDYVQRLSQGIDAAIVSHKTKSSSRILFPNHSQNQIFDNFRRF